MSNKNPLEILKEEHRKVLKVLDNLEKSLEDRDIKSSEENINILKKEFEIHSLNKEEKVLFPEIEKFMPREGGPTGMMIMEHKDLVSSISNFKNVVKTKDNEKLSEIGNHILSILRRHIDKENNILFMMADMHLDEKQRKVILEKFSKIDEKYK